MFAYVVSSNAGGEKDATTPWDAAMKVRAFIETQTTGVTQVIITPTGPNTGPIVNVNVARSLAACAPTTADRYRVLGAIACNEVLETLYDLDDPIPNDYVNARKTVVVSILLD